MKPIDWAIGAIFALIAWIGLSYWITVTGGRDVPCILGCM